MADTVQTPAAERKLDRSIRLPAHLAPYFEAAVIRRGISAGVTYHNDGSRTYHVDAEAWDEQAVLAAAEEGVRELRATLAPHGAAA